jgi:conjugative transfer signal peptidase TraF
MAERFGPTSPPKDPAIRSGRARAQTSAALAGIALLCTLPLHPRPLLLWNASASSRVGLYLVSAPGKAQVGDMVVAWPPLDASRLASERRYLPAGVPLVKRVAGASGDRVCASGGRLFVDGRIAAVRQRHDPSGRPMPWWSGCTRLGRGDLLLLGTGGARSFDGRYFGVSRAAQVIGRARLLWPR